MREKIPEEVCCLQCGLIVLTASILFRFFFQTMRDWNLTRWASAAFSLASTEESVPPSVTGEPVVSYLRMLAIAWPLVR